MKKFGEVFHYSVLLDLCKGYENTFIEDVEGTYKDDGEDSYSAFLFTLVSGSHGHYIPNELRKVLDITDDDLEIEEGDGEIPDWFWDSLDRLGNDFVEEFNNDLLDRGIEGQVYLGFLDADGSYGLFYWIATDLVESIREEESELIIVCESDELDLYYNCKCGRPSEMCYCHDNVGEEE